MNKKNEKIKMEFKQRGKRKKSGHVGEKNLIEFFLINISWNELNSFDVLRSIYSKDVTGTQNQCT